MTYNLLLPVVQADNMLQMFETTVRSWRDSNSLPSIAQSLHSFRGQHSQAYIYPDFMESAVDLTVPMATPMNSALDLRVQKDYMATPMESARTDGWPEIART